jgi:hypothetical protein
MSIPSHPSHPPHRSNAPGDSPPRPAAHDTRVQTSTDPHDVDAPAEHAEEPPQAADARQPRMPRLGQPPPGKRIVRPGDAPALNLTAEQRLLLLDTWRRSGLPAHSWLVTLAVNRRR